MIDNTEWMKRVGLVFLGFVSIIIIYLLLMLVPMMVGGKVSSGNEGGHGPSLGALFILMTIVFLMGSVVTGYFSYYEF